MLTFSDDPSNGVTLEVKLNIHVFALKTDRDHVQSIKYKHSGKMFKETDSCNKKIVLSGIFSLNHNFKITAHRCTTDPSCSCIRWKYFYLQNEKSCHS